ncbi:MAG TPA: hypothetical protein VMW65_00620 [Chloroflexota bacterium]|nr:hypothetical protein [Chloroflexota bacterium]
MISRMALRNDPRRQLRAQVADFALARRRTEAIRRAVWGIAIGGALAALAGIAIQFTTLSGGPAIAGTLGVVLVIAAAIVGWLDRVPETRVALEVDHHLGLNERVTTAVEMAAAASEHPLAERQIADAVAHLVTVRRGAVYPIRLSGRLQVLAVLGIVLAVLPWVIPWSTVPALRPRTSIAAAASRAEADRLDQVASHLEQQNTPEDQASRSALATQLRQVAAQLRSDGGNTQQAISDLQRAQQLAASTAPQTGEDASLTLARIADALNNTSATQPITQALDQQNLAQALAALNQTASQLGSMSPAQRAELAQALQTASNAARGSDTNAAQQLQQAAQAAQNGNAAGLQQAAQALQQLTNASQAQQDASQAQSEMQASSEAITQSAQSGSTAQNASTNPTASNSQADSSGQATSSNQVGSSAQSSADQTGQSAAASSDQNGGAGQSANGSQQGQTGTANGQGNGAGTGSTNHLGAAHDVASTSGQDVFVPNSQNGAPGTISQSNQLQAPVGGGSQVDYRNVLPEYQKQALQAVQNNTVPTDLKQVVRGYFDSLAPGK